MVDILFSSQSCNSDCDCDSENNCDDTPIVNTGCSCDDYDPFSDCNIYSCANNTDS